MPPPPTHSDSSRSAASSAPAPTSPGVAATASRFLLSVRRSFSPPAAPRRKSAISSSRVAMYSTPEERHARNTSRAGFPRYLDSRPTIEQIAMGLHVSRTPHLRPVAGPALPSPPPRRALGPQIHSSPGSSAESHETSTPSSQHRPRRSLPPPPSRSSMKKSTPSVSTLTQSPQQRSSSEVSPSVSGNPPVSQLPPRPLSSLRVRMSKFFPGYRPLSSPSAGRASSVTSSASDSTRPTTPRKAVRFSTSVFAIEEQSSQVHS